MVEGYCLKEKKKVQVNDPKYEVNARGQPVIKGTCSSCGGKIYKIIKWDEAPAELRSKRKTGGVEGGIAGGNETAGVKKGGAATARSKSRSSRSAAQKSRDSRSAKSSATQKSRGAQKSRGGRAAAQKSRNKTSSRKSLGTGRSSNSRKARK